MSVRTNTLRTELSSVLHHHLLLLIACLAMLAVAVVFWQSFSRLVGMWSLSDYQYGWFVYPIALYVLWSKRHTLAKATVRPSWLGVGLSACLVVVWVLARTVGVQVVEFVAVSAMAVSVFWAVAGTNALRIAIFPLALLLTAVPAGEFLVYYLQESTASIASALLHLAGIPAFREGLFMTLPGGSFEVAEACGGLRYLLAAVMASLAYAYLAYSGIAKRVFFVTVAAATMVVANGIRAFIVMVIASATDMQVFAGRDHVYFGMVLFATVFAGLIYFGERYADISPSNTYPQPVAALASRGSFRGVAIGVLLILSAGPALLYLQSHQPLPVLVTADLPEFQGCNAPTTWSWDWSPEFSGADRLQRASYDCDAHGVGVYFASYAVQVQGKELISSANRVWPHAWRRYVDETATTLASEYGSADVRQVYVNPPGRSMLIWYWYQVGDSVLSSDVAVILSTAVHAVGLQPVAASVVAVHAEVPGEASIDELRDTLEPKARVLMSWYQHSANLATRERQ
jgi:exosortase A